MQEDFGILKNIALETDKLLSDTTTTTHGYEKTVSDKGFAFLVKDRILSDRKIATLENDYAVSHNRSDNVGNVLFFLFEIYYYVSINNKGCSFKIS
ncbi:hypothetical protein DPMN_065055 [Dreissena polymorpha]|uniref:Uncharacterized protein n=1 Tax=Dreissena polymorpha TaxID=45954 RepID=A0A9D4HLP5_DREPO|nr:hypothetical protein DPMN_065055 [Dreissena polymorpha]